MLPAWHAGLTALATCAPRDDNQGVTEVNVSEAVARRVSIRAYSADPVPGELVREVLRKAGHAPSGGNLQPWKVAVLAGEPLARFKALVAARQAAGQTEQAEYDVYPPNLWEPLRARRTATRPPRFRALGFDPSDKAGDRELGRLNADFFGAPVALFFSIDRRCGKAQWSDMGMFYQTVMLLAVEAGLDTCPQMFWARWPKTIAEFTGMPDDHTIYAGMSMGYRDPAHPINAIVTEREPLESYATFIGL